MRSVIIALLLFTFSFASQAQKKAYEIKVKITSLKDTVCYLANYYGDKQYLKDTAKVDNEGKMIFDGKEKLPGGIYLVVLPSKKWFEIIVDKEQSFSIETDTLDLVKNLKVKGSVENKYFYEYLGFIAKKAQEMEPLREKMKTLKDKKDSLEILQKQGQAIDKEVKDYKLNFMKEHPETFNAVMFKAMMEPEIPETPILSNGRKDSSFAYKYYKAHFWDNIDFADERLLRTPIYFNKLKQYMETVTVQMPDSINASADIVVKKARANKEIFKFTVYWLTYTYETSKIMGMDAVFVHMAENYITHDQAYWLDSAQVNKIRDRAKVLGPLTLGKKSPPVIMRDTSEKIQSLHNVKAKYTVLYFWDHDCSHCKKETPKLHDMYVKLKSKGVEVFAVETSQEVVKWKQFVKEHKLSWINVSDPYYQTGFKKTFDIYSTPVIYLLDENKKFLAKRLDVEQLEKIIEHFIEKDKKKAEQKPKQ